jgi:hypothetical protein
MSGGTRTAEAEPMDVCGMGAGIGDMDEAFTGVQAGSKVIRELQRDGLAGLKCGNREDGQRERQSAQMKRQHRKLPRSFYYS